MKTTFNGKSGDGAIIRPWIQALNDPRIVTEKAGFLFKASRMDEGLEIAASPVLINGERLCHYNMHLKHEDAFTLMGDVNAMGVFTILFKPERLPLSAEQKVRYTRTFQTFAALLLEQGYSGEGRIHEVTQDVLTKLDLCPAPDTLAALADSTTS